MDNAEAIATPWGSFRQPLAACASWHVRENDAFVLRQHCSGTGGLLGRGVAHYVNAGEDRSGAGRQASAAGLTHGRPLRGTAERLTILVAFCRGDHRHGAVPQGAGAAGGRTRSRG